MEAMVFVGLKTYYKVILTINFCYEESDSEALSLVW